MNIRDIKNISANWVNGLEVANDYKNRIILNNSDRNLTVIGMRRLGKTDFLKYKALESNLTAEKILFIDLDDPIFSGIDFSTRSEGRTQFITNIDSLLALGNIKLVLFDEVQRLFEWARVLKGLIDKYPNIRFYSTGSDAIQLLKNEEQGTGRFEIRYMGIYTFAEFLTLKGEKQEDYIDGFSFPPYTQTSIVDKFQAVIEKQILTSKYKALNIHAIFKNISLNPGIKLTKSATVRMVTTNSDASFDHKQVESFINFLVQSQLILAIPDKYSYNKPSKKTIYTLYPFDWNSYKYYRINTEYRDLKTKIDKTDKIKELPTSWFVFENMIISNIYSMFNNPLQRNRLSNKVDIPDVDIYIDDQAYEIKSFDVHKLEDDELIDIINKAKQTNSIIIHTGQTKETSNVKFVNWKELLEEIK